MQQQTYFLLRRLALFIILMNIFLNYSYAENTRQRSINNKAEIQGIKKENEALRLYIDSISNNISKQEIQISNIITEYKIDQSYFDTAIKMQTAIYSSIIAAVFFLLGVYSYFTYKNALEKVETNTEDKLQEQKTTIETQLSEQKTAIEDSQHILNDIIEKQIEKQNTTFERVKTQMHNTIEKQFSGQKSKFEILKKEIELDSQSSLSKEIVKHEQAFQKLVSEITLDITKQIEKQKAEFEGVKSNMETKVGFLLGSQMENFKEQKEKIDANLELELLNYKKELDDFKDKMTVLELSILGTSANSYMTITHDFFKRKKWINALDFSLSATNCHFKRVLIKKEDPKYVIAALKRALKALEQIEKNNSLKNKVNNLYNTQWKEKINSFATSNHDEVQNLVSELRMRIHNYTIE